MNPGKVSWLDHCISTQDGHHVINSMQIEYHLSCRDHIPLVLSLGLDKLPSVEDEVNCVSPSIKWDEQSSTKLREYTLMSDICLSRISIPREVIECNNINCELEDHTSKLRTLYGNICESFVDASNTVFGVKKVRNLIVNQGSTSMLRNCMILLGSVLWHGEKQINQEILIIHFLEK